jgi:hypothetical protein
LDFKEDEQNKGWGVKFLENKWQGSKWKRGLHQS